MREGEDRKVTCVREGEVRKRQAVKGQGEKVRRRRDMSESGNTSHESVINSELVVSTI